MKLVLLPHRLYLAEADRVPDSAWASPFFVLVQVEGRRTLVLPQEHLPEGANAEGPFRAFAFAGPLPLTMIGILGRVGTVLAEAGVSLFAYSAYETDYVLVREAYLKLATEALKEAGYEVEV